MVGFSGGRRRGGGGSRSLGSNPITDASAYTASAIANAAAQPNNSYRKFEGAVVWDSTNKRYLRASGSDPFDPWDVIDGSASVTPVAGSNLGPFWFLPTFNLKAS